MVCIGRDTTVQGVFMRRLYGVVPLPEARLLDHVRTVARLRHLSSRTEQTSRQAIKRCIVFHAKRHPREMGGAEIRAYVTYRAVERHGAASTHTVALSALRFLSRDGLKITVPTIDAIERAHWPTRLPIVWSRACGPVRAAPQLSQLPAITSFGDESSMMDRYVCQ